MSTEEILQKRAEAYKNAFAGPDGEAVLKDLQMFKNRDLFDGNPLVMAANCAKHDLILRIENMIALGQGTLKPVRPRVITQRNREIDAGKVNFPLEE